MAAKKHSQRTTADKTLKGRHTTDTTDQAVPDEPSASAERTPVETAEAASAPTAEAKTADTPMPAEGETSQPDPTVPHQPTPGKKRSALDAAVKVLGETGQAMNCPELIAAMAAKGYWKSPKGRTPASTLYAAVLREIQTRGDQARFRKTERGKFALRVTV
jgi:HB1, ASXL, restriction endonuclease HTH domain